MNTGKTKETHARLCQATNPRLNNSHIEHRIVQLCVLRFMRLLSTMVQSELLFLPSSLKFRFLLLHSLIVRLHHLSPQLRCLVLDSRRFLVHQCC
jgi:hypothetical protein